MKRGRAGICDHERRVGKEEAETQDPSAESLKEMRMGREIWEQRVMSQSQDNTNMGGGCWGWTGEGTGYHTCHSSLKCYSPAGQEDSLPEFLTLKHEILFLGAEGLSSE